MQTTFTNSNNPFSETFVAKSKIYGDQEREQKLAKLLNASKAARLTKDIENCPLSPVVSLGKNFMILNYQPHVQTQEESDPQTIIAMMNLVTESSLGNIHAEKGFQIAAFNKLGSSSRVPHFGAVNLGYEGKWSDMIDGLEKFKSNTGDADFDAVRNTGWAQFDLENGRFVVTGLLKKIAYVGDSRLMPDQVRINNSWITKIVALDILLGGKPVFCYFNDYLSAYAAEKWHQFDLDTAALKARKAELIAAHVVKKEQARAYGEIERAQSETPEGVATQYPMPNNKVKIVLGGKVVVHVLEADGEHPVVPNMEYDQYLGMSKARKTLVLGDDAISRSRMSVLAAKFVFAPHTDQN